MYLFKNACKNLFRNKGRNLLIFLVLLLMVTGATTCSIIRAATQQKIASAQQTLPVKVIGNLNFMKMEEDSKYSEEKLIDGTVFLRRLSSPNMDLTVDQMKTLLASPLLDHSVTTFGSPIYSPTLQFVDNGNALSSGLAQYHGADKQTLYQLVENIYQLKYEYYASDAFKTSSLFLTLYGEKHQLTEDEIQELSARTVFGDTLYQQYMSGQTLNDDLVNEALAIYYDEDEGMIEYLTSHYLTQASLAAFPDENTDFSGGANVLTEGHMPEKENECAVGSQFAALNNLSIGSKFSVQSTKISDTQALELTVCGIYKEAAWDASHNALMAPDPNNIYVTPEVIYNTKLEGSWTIGFGTEFYLKSADDVEEFQALMKANGFNEYYTLQSNLAAREEVLEPLRKVSSLMSTILIAVLVLGGAIFLLLTFFAVRERKYEIGVLRAIGMKKKSVIRGFLYETVIIVVICCVLGMTAGAFVSQPMLNLMVNTSASAPTTESGGQTMGNSGSLPDGSGNSIGNPTDMMMGGGEILTMDENGNFVDQDGNPVSNENMMIGDAGTINEGASDTTPADAEQPPEYDYSGSVQMGYMDENGNLISTGDPQANNEELQIGDISAYLTWQTVALILGTALLLAALAVVIAGLYITKFEPIKILSNQE